MTALSVRNETGKTQHGRPLRWGYQVESARRKRGTNVRTRTNFLPLTDREAAQKFSALVIDFPAGQLAQAAARTKDSAKGWKKARAFPSGASLINMCRALPSVYEWLQDEIEHGGDPIFESDHALTQSFDAVIRLASQDGKQGDKARAIINEAAKLAAKGGEA